MLEEVRQLHSKLETDEWEAFSDVALHKFKFRVFMQ